MFTSKSFRTSSIALLLGAPLTGCAVGKQDEKLTAGIQMTGDAS